MGLINNLIQNGSFKEIVTDASGVELTGTAGQVKKGWKLESGSVSFIRYGHATVANPPSSISELADKSIGFVRLNGDRCGVISTQTIALQDGDKISVSWWASCSIDIHTECSPSYSVGYHHSVQIGDTSSHKDYLEIDRIKSEDGWKKNTKVFTVKGSGVKKLFFQGDTSDASCGIVISSVIVELASPVLQSQAKLLRLAPATCNVALGETIDVGAILVSEYEDFTGRQRLSQNIKVLLELTRNGGNAVFSDNNLSSVTIDVVNGQGKIPEIVALGRGEVQLSATSFGVNITDTMTIVVH
jgi:hypothetical protein